MPDDFCVGAFPTRERAVAFMRLLADRAAEYGLADEWAIFAVNNVVWIHTRTDDERLRHLWIEHTLKPSLRSAGGTDDQVA